MKGLGALVLATCLTGCGLLAMPGIPDWCGGVGSGGEVSPPGATPQPLATMDPSHLRCIFIENWVNTDMALQETLDGKVGSWALIPACSVVTASEPLATSPWTLQVGRAAKPSGIDGPILATFASADLIGQGGATASPPYLIRVVIDQARHVTISQADSLPANRTAKLC